MDLIDTMLKKQLRGKRYRTVVNGFGWVDHRFCPGWFHRRTVLPRPGAVPVPGDCFGRRRSFVLVGAQSCRASEPDPGAG